VLLPLNLSEEGEDRAGAALLLYGEALYADASHATSRRLRSNDGFASGKGTLLRQQSKLNQSHSVCVSSLLKRTLLFVALEPLLPGTGPAISKLSSKLFSKFSQLGRRSR